MSQAGYTPIQLYYSTTAAAAPSAGNLAAGELAVNITDGKLFYKDNGGVVRVLATAAGAAGDVVGPGSSTDNALVRFDGTTGKLVQSSVGILSDAGALSGLTSVAATTFTGALTGNASTATTLQTSRTIWGQSFDGSANVTGALTGVTDLTASGSLTLSGGTANGVTYLNGSKVLTSGSALTFNGTKLQIGSFGSSGRLLETYGSEALFDGAGQFDLLMGDGGVAYMSLTTTDNATALKIRNYSGSSDIAVFERATGNVGIGTSSPGTALHVQRSSANAVLRLSSSGGSGRDWNINSQTDGYLTIGSDLLAGQLNLYQGNLGIGITAAARRLEVSGAGSGETYQLRLGAGNSNISFTYDIGRSTVDGLFRFYGNQTGFVGYIFGGVDGERARIDSSGNLLVGTTSAAYSMVSTFSGGISSINSAQFNIAAGSVATDFEWVLRQGARQLYYVNNASVVASLSLTGVWTNASDARYKENIVDSQYGLAAVMALRPRAYNLIDQADKPQIGFIAQEMLKVVPEVVESVHNSITDEDRYTLSYGNLVAVLTKAIQEQQAIITALTARVAALESN
jgi:hypothetical protein